MPKKAKKHNKRTGRDYRAEYARYQGKPAQIKRRAKRNKARALMIKRGKARKGDGKDVHHSDSRSLSTKGLRVVSRSKNRGFRRSKTGKNLGLRKKK